jgi:hypothetical protein
MYLFRPLVFTFASETDEFIQSEEKKLRQAIEGLADMPFCVGREQFSISVRITGVYNHQDPSYYSSCFKGIVS